MAGPRLSPHTSLDTLSIRSLEPRIPITDEEDILNVLYGELITKDTIVAPSGRLETVSGKLITSWSDGMPGKFEFTLPKGETGFVIKSGNQSVVQDVSSVL